MGRVSVNAQTVVFMFVSVIAVSKEYTSKILGQDVSIRPLFGL